MTKKSKLLIGSISFIIITLIIILCLYSYNNLDVANANLSSDLEPISLAYPYASPSNTLIESNLIGFSNLGLNNLQITGNYYSSLGVLFAASTNSGYNPYLNFASYSMNSYDYIGFSLKNSNAINPYFNGSRYINIHIPADFLISNRTYSFAFTLKSIINNSSASAIMVYAIDQNWDSTLLYDFDFDIGHNFSFPKDLSVYFNYTHNTSNYKYIRFTIRTEITGNLFITEGNYPVFIDNMSKVFVKNINASGNYSYESNMNNYNLYGNTNLFNYNFLFYAMTNQLSLFWAESKDSAGLITFSAVPDISFSDNYFQIVAGGSTIKFYKDYWNVSLGSNTSLSFWYFNYFSYLYDYDVILNNTASGSYSLGYNDGLSDGNSSGYNNGYSVGYNDGLSLAQNGTFLVLLTSVVEAPFNAFLKIFDFNILGYNMKAFLGALISISIALFVIRMILNGSTKNG